MNPSTPWYQPTKGDPEDEQKRAMHLLAETSAIEQRQFSWHRLNLWNATLFSNRVMPAFRWGDPNADGELEPADLRTENLIEAIGESFMSKAASSPLKPSLVPHGQRLETERAVRIADNFVFGCWQQTKAEEACIQMFLDAYISSVGCVRVALAGGKKPKLKVESVFFDNIIIDNRECVGRQAPRHYRIRQVLPSAAVEARYGIELDKKQPYTVDNRQAAPGWTVVVEAWRLPDENGEGGYHMVAAGNRVLKEEKWTHDWVPLVFFRWGDYPSGFVGKSGVEQLVPFQNRQNELNDAIEKSMDITCVPRLLLNANSMVNVDQWDNEFGRMLLYSGIKPEPFEWKTDLATLASERERNRAGAFSHVGLSEQFAGADMPSQVRLDSSAGVREFHNMEDRRNLRRWSRYEDARLEVAKTMIRVLGTEKGADAYSTYFHPGGSAASIQVPFEAIKQLSEDDYSWRMAATPISAMAPAARRELLRDWTSRGLIKEGSDEARRMEGNPNLEREEEMEMASKEDIDLRVLDILEKGGYEPPSIATNTVYGIPRVAANFHRLKTYEDVKPNDPRLVNHLKWIVAAIARRQELSMMTQQQQPQMTPFSPTQGVAGTSSSNGPPTIIQGEGYSA